ncbi:DUF4350 domain-containing protein [Curtobacterium sp. VKM Ac-2922]|uniref:DUF4350 domain-containing protein n=1 Tax=Curtobacterium sp. VKM Ac-2922 TaxID=2929475 RepID=UPI001FB1F904|nr:DUF4350 domain-containing protein [Curtobacterium sp. VKM Ac-2922]MCJ1713335.1 DUF4350 domain-containing protein [Curtobacterium sp. VKM Ac-2922]
MSAPTVAPRRTDERPHDTESAEAPVRAGRGLRIVSWVAIVLIGVLLAALTAAIGGGTGPTDTPLDPTSTAASGSRALVRVLEQQGTDVDVVHDADRLGADPGTVFVDDSAGVLAPSVARRIARTVPDVVLVTTDSAVLEAFRTRATPAAQVESDDTVSTASCGIPAAGSARRVSTTGVAYSAHGSGVVRCAPTGTGSDRAWGLVQASTPAGQVTLVGTTGAFRNDSITTAGNAALALGLLGGDDRLAWYVPTAGSTDAAPSLGELAPLWVPSAIALLAAVAVAAGIWRGRRLGPLVVEQLPVVVRASETTEGRARLAARTRDRTHALDTLRIAAVRRLGRALGLPRSAHVDEVVRRVAAATGRPADAVGAVLVGGPATDDRSLVGGARALDELEHAVTRAVAGDAPRASRPTDHTTGPPQPEPPTDPRPGGRP